MGDGTHFAIALILFWLAGVCFFVAFHPGYIQINGRRAQNPVDVLRYLMHVMLHGSGTASSASDLTNPGNPGGNVVA